MISCLPEKGKSLPLTTKHVSENLLGSKRCSVRLDKSNTGMFRVVRSGLFHSVSPSQAECVSGDLSLSMAAVGRMLQCPVGAVGGLEGNRWTGSVVVDEEIQCASFPFLRCHCASSSLEAALNLPPDSSLRPETFSSSCYSIYAIASFPGFLLSWTETES